MHLTVSINFWLSEILANQLLCNKKAKVTIIHNYTQSLSEREKKLKSVVRLIICGSAECVIHPLGRALVRIKRSGGNQHILRGRICSMSKSI